MEFGKLIPQVFFDILARFVPGAILLGSWIVLLGQYDWSRLLKALLGGYLYNGNALLASALTFSFLSFALGYVLAPFAKGVQRLNEARWYVLKKLKWVTKDGEVGKRYDWLRARHPDVGALSAKIRAEYTMYNALSVVFVAITIMASIRGSLWALPSFLGVPLMIWRGSKTQETFQETTMKLSSELDYEKHEKQRGVPHSSPDSQAES
jgi:hypothetical protein